MVWYCSSVAWRLGLGGWVVGVVVEEVVRGGGGGGGGEGGWGWILKAGFRGGWLLVEMVVRGVIVMIVRDGMGCSWLDFKAWISRGMIVG